jgi:hypothetical protein
MYSQNDQRATRVRGLIPTLAPKFPTFERETEYIGLRADGERVLRLPVDAELRRLGEVEVVGEPSAVWLGVPLIVGSKTIGVMVVQHYDDPRAYGVPELHMLEYVSSQVAKAIERKKAADKLRQSEEQFRLLFEEGRSAWRWRPINWTATSIPIAIGRLYRRPQSPNINISPCAKFNISIMLNRSVSPKATSTYRRANNNPLIIICMIIWSIFAILQAGLNTLLLYCV